MHRPSALLFATVLTHPLKEVGNEGKHAEARCYFEEEQAVTNHAFHEIYLHITWHNNHDMPISPKVEPDVYTAILEKCRMTAGVYVHGIGGTETHVHIAISIEPTVLISDMIGQVKGASSHAVNQRYAERPIAWKRGYGIVSFSKRDLPWVLAYIRNQKQHHQQGTLAAKLERVDTGETVD